MDLAVLASVVARAPLGIRSASDAAPFDLAQTCAAHGLECATLDARDLTPAPPAVDVLIVRGLAGAPRATQARAIDLLRAPPPRLLLFIALLPPDGALTPLLNDRLLLVHTHTHAHRRRATDPPPATAPRARIAELQDAAARVKLAPETLRYAHDVATHLRLHRAVAGGVSAVASRQLVVLTRALAVLNGQAFATPAVVALAARHVFAHRLRLAGAATERSVQWGSDAAAVARALAGATAAGVVDEVLATVEVPL